MGPIVHGLEAKYQDQIGFVYLDIDNPSTDKFKAQLGCFVQPDFFLLDSEGNVLNRWTGPVPTEELEAAFITALEG